jgi:hypothetical protein
MVKEMKYFYVSYVGFFAANNFVYGDVPVMTGGGLSLAGVKKDLATKYNYTVVVILMVEEVSKTDFFELNQKAGN